MKKIPKFSDYEKMVKSIKYKGFSLEVFNYPSLLGDKYAYRIYHYKKIIYPVKISARNTKKKFTGYDNYSSNLTHQFSKEHLKSEMKRIVDKLELSDGVNGN